MPSFIFILCCGPPVHGGWVEERNPTSEYPILLGLASSTQPTMKACGWGVYVMRVRLRKPHQPAGIKPDPTLGLVLRRRKGKRCDACACTWCRAPDAGCR